MKKYVDINMVYPVGSIYLSVSDANPTVLFGGTWERIQNVFLLGASDYYPSGSTGGEFEHTLTVDEMPNHQHDIRNQEGVGDNGLCATIDGVTSGEDGTSWCFWDKPVDKTNNRSGNFATTFVGGSQPHNNMPPYLAVYMWKRIS